MSDKRVKSAAEIARDREIFNTWKESNYRDATEKLCRSSDILRNTVDRIREKGLVAPIDDLFPLLPYPSLTEAQLYNAMLDVKDSQEQTVINRRVARVCSETF